MKRDRWREKIRVALKDLGEMTTVELLEHLNHENKHGPSMNELGSVLSKTKGVELVRTLNRQEGGGRRTGLWRLSE